MLGPSEAICTCGVDRCCQIALCGVSVGLPLVISLLLVPVLLQPQQRIELSQSGQVKSGSLFCFNLHFFYCEWGGASFHRLRAVCVFSGIVGPYPLPNLKLGLLILFLLICRNSLHIRKISLCLLRVVSTWEFREGPLLLWGGGCCTHSERTDGWVEEVGKRRRREWHSARSGWQKAAWALALNSHDFTLRFCYLPCDLKQPVSSFLKQIIWGRRALSTCLALCCPEQFPVTAEPWLPHLENGNNSFLKAY